MSAATENVRHLTTLAIEAAGDGQSLAASRVRTLLTTARAVVGTTRHDEGHDERAQLLADCGAELAKMEAGR
ncbi:MAG: hypothetical protein KC731_24425 [Myxococcales bacterium]|nr:hypothetical protein [Myxococcales bacterium]